jgi:hypothetical protein
MKKNKIFIFIHSKVRTLLFNDEFYEIIVISEIVLFAGFMHTKLKFNYNC